MKDIIFSPYKIKYKSIKNAVQINHTVKFNLSVTDRFVVYYTKLICWSEKTKIRCEYNMQLTDNNSGYNIFTVSFTPLDLGLYFYHFEVCTDYSILRVGRNDMNDAVYTDGDERWINAFQLSVYDRKYQVPEWFKGGIMYHIFVDRFNRAGESHIKSNVVMHSNWNELPVYLPDKNGVVQNIDFFGGNLLGIEKKLDYLKSLNVSCIYLSPIFEARSNHKYDTGNYKKIDSMFGTNDDFKKLCQSAKAMGISIILDGVFSHTGDDSIYFNRYGNYESIGAYQSKHSPYYSWYRFFEHPNKFDSWWGIQTLPAVDESNANYKEYINGINGVVPYWLEQGASGFRLDVADELNEDFLYDLAKSAKSKKPDSLLIGEVWEDASNKEAYGYRRHYFEGEQLDSVMNYPAMNGIISYIKNRDASKLARVLNSIYDNYPTEVINCLMNILGTHDTKRIITSLSNLDIDHMSKQYKSQISLSPKAREQAKKLVKIASLLQYTLPGVPCVYYGDEIAIEGFEDPLNRTTYPWGNEDMDMLKWYKILGKIRAEHSDIFSNGEYNCIKANGDIFIFERLLKNSKLFIACNVGSESVEVDAHGFKKELLTDKELNSNITIEGFSCVICK